MSYYNSSNFKQEGKRALQGKWQTAIAVCFAPAIIGFLLDAIMIVGLRAGVFRFRQIGYMGVVFTTSIPSNMAATLWMLFILLVNMFFIPTLVLGVQSYFMAIHRGENPSWKKVFSQMPHWWRNVRLMLAKSLFIGLWSLLFFVPGIIASISYALATYLIIDNENMGAMESIRQSKQIMQGKKMFYFMLTLSFIGWQFLLTFVGTVLGDSIISSVVTQVGALFLQAYLQSTFAAFYLYAKN